MAAKKKPLEVRPAALGEVRLTVEAMALPPERRRAALRRRGRRRGARAGAAAPHRSEGALMATMFAFAETRGGELRKVAFEAVTAARQAADASGGGEVHALIIGAPGIAAKAEALGRYGADVVIVVEHAASSATVPKRSPPRAAERLRAGDYRAAFFPASAEGRDLAPRVAAKLGVALASDVTAFELKGDAVLAQHPGLHRQSHRHAASHRARRRSSRSGRAR